MTKVYSKKGHLLLFCICSFFWLLMQSGEGYTQAQNSSVQIYSEIDIQCKREEGAVGPSDPDLPDPVYQNCIKACDSSTLRYYTNPVAGATYQWSVNGSLNFTQNTDEVFVTWGQHGQGSITLIVNYANGDADSVSRCVEIVESPTANFYTMSGESNGVIEVCLDQPVDFFDNSVNAANWEWDFGDGNFYTGQNPPAYNYQSSGTYDVTLIVKNDCNCPDTLTKTVEVQDLSGPEIICPSVVCAGDTVEYSTQADCGNYNWTVDGGSIISTPQNSNSIMVVWGNEPDGLGTVTLDVSPCGGYCTVPSSISVPIIPSSAQITGDSVVCLGSSGNYKLPKICGTKFTWDLSPQGDQIYNGQGTNEISVFWDNPGAHTLEVDYYNEFLGCGGTAELEIQVAPEFYISGPEQLCAFTENASNPFYSVSPQGFVDSDWSVTTPGGNVLSNLETNNSQFSTYDWSDGTGTYQVMAVSTGSNTCNDTAYLQITVYEAPPMPSIDGVSMICPGSTHQYTPSSVNSSMTYNWSASGGTIIPSSAQGSVISVEWDGNPPYSLSLVQSMTSSPNCSSDSFHLPISQIDNPVISGSDVVCPDAIVGYTATFHQQLDYQWSISPPGAGSIVSGNGSDSIGVIWYNSQSSAELSISYPNCPDLITPDYAVTITQPVPPVINQSGVLCENGQVTLTSSNAASYLWTDGDNQVIGTSQSVVVDQKGNYNLEVTNSQGCTTSDNIYISEEPSPDASISTPDALHYCDVQQVPSVTLYALEGAGYSYQWYLNGNAISQATNSTHSTNITGSYYVVVTLGNCTDTSNTLTLSQSPDCGNGCETQDFVEIIVNQQQPVCNPVSFTGQVSAGIGTHVWNFDDPQSGSANTSTSLNVTHDFSSAGFYQVTFTGTGVNSSPPPDSCSITQRTVVEIPLVAKFKYDGLCVGQPVMFTDLSTHTPGNTITSWDWSFDDPSSGNANTSTMQNPSHVFSSAGQYVVSLTVSTGNCTDTYTDTLNIEAVNASFSPVPVPVCAGSPVTFNSSTTSNVPVIDSYWDFDDGNTSMLDTPQKTFSQAGVYNISLAVTNSMGCSDTVMNPVDVIEPVEPGSIELIGDNPFCQSDSVQLSAPASNAYMWSTGATTQSIYVNQAGSYDVAIVGQAGCTVTLPPVDVIEKPAPEFELIGPDIACESEGFQLCTALEGQYDYQWFFNNTEIQNAQNNCYNLFNVDQTDEGTYSLTVTDQQTGCSYTDSKYVTINPAPADPVISSNNQPPLCAGSPTIISVNNPDSQLDYIWSSGQTGTSISVSASGFYRVQAVNEFGCSSYSNFVTIAPKPETECVMTGCYEFCDTLKPKTISGPPGYASYNWLQIDTTTNTTTSIGTSQSLVVNNSGVYQLVITNQDGCVDTTDLIKIHFVPCIDCDELEVTAIPSLDEDGNLLDCCVDITFENNYSDTLISSVGITSLDGAVLDPTFFNTNWTAQNLTDSSFIAFPPEPLLGLGIYEEFMRICASNTTSLQQTIVFQWYGQQGEQDILCTDTITFECEPGCVDIIEDILYCRGDSLIYEFSIYNNSHTTIQAVELVGSLGVQLSNPMVTIPPLPPDSFYGPVTRVVSSSGTVQPGEDVCFVVTAYESEDFADDEFICNNDSLYCTTMPPLCNPCDLLDVTGMTADTTACCINLTLENNYNDSLISSVGISAVNAAQADVTVFEQNWSVQSMTNSSFILFPPGNALDMGTLDDIIQVCLTNTTGTQQPVVINWYGTDGDLDTLCSDTVYFECEPGCVEIIEDIMYCKGDSLIYEYYLWNNSNTTIQAVDVSASQGVQISPAQVTIPPLQPGSSYGPVITVVTNPGTVQPGDEVCFNVTAYESEDFGDDEFICNNDSLYCATVPQLCNPCDSLDVTGMTADTTACCVDLTLESNYNDSLISHVSISALNGAVIDFPVFTEYLNPEKIQNNLMHLYRPVNGTNDQNIFDENLTICLSEISGQQQTLIVSWIGYDGETDTLCTDTVHFDCETGCVEVIDDRLHCQDGSLIYEFSIINHTNSVIRAITLNETTSQNVQLSPSQISIPPLQPNGTYGPVSTVVSGQGVVTGDTICFNVTAYTSEELGDNDYICSNDSLYCQVVPPLCNPCDLLHVTGIDSDTEECCVNITLENNYSDNLISHLGISALNGAETDYTVTGANWSATDLTDSSFLVEPPGNAINLGTLDDIVRVCLSNTTGTQQAIVINWYGFEGDLDTLCTDTVYLECEGGCVSIIEDILHCEDGGLIYEFYVENNSNTVIQSVTLNAPPGVTLSQTHFSIPPLQPNNSYGPLTTAVSGSGAVPGEEICFSVTAYDSENAENYDFICNNDTSFCQVVPRLCNPCDSLNVAVIGDDLNCCWQLDLTNNSYLGLTGIQTKILSSGSFSNINIPAGSDWTAQNNSQSDVMWTYTGSYNYPQLLTLPEFCIESSDNQNSFMLEVIWILQGDDGEEFECRDTLTLNCRADCMVITKDTVVCDDDGQYFYEFTVFNNYHLDIESFEFFQVDPPASFGQGLITASIPVSTSASFTLPVFGEPGQQVCFRIRAYDAPGLNEYFNCCATDSLYCIILPDCGGCVPRIDGPDVICKGHETEICLEPCCDALDISWSNDSNEPCTFVDEPGQYVVKWQCDERVFHDTINIALADTCDDTGIQGISKPENRLKVYPNPVDNLVNVKFTMTKDSRVTISVFDMDGKRVDVIHDAHVQAMREYEIEHDFSTLPKNMYILRLINHEGVIIHRKLVR